MSQAKYIKTADNDIIVFSMGISHDFFKFMKPVSAGFISIGVDKEGNPDCTCYGKSDSLGLKSDPDDASRANQQIINPYF